MLYIVDLTRDKENTLLYDMQGELGENISEIAEAATKLANKYIYPNKYLVNKWGYIRSKTVNLPSKIHQINGIAAVWNTLKESFHKVECSYEYQGKVTTGEKDEEGKDIEEDNYLAHAVGLTSPILGTYDVALNNSPLISGASAVYSGTLSRHSLTQSMERFESPIRVRPSSSLKLTLQEAIECPIIRNENGNADANAYKEFYGDEYTGRGGRLDYSLKLYIDYD